MVSAMGALDILIFLSKNTPLETVLSKMRFAANLPLHACAIAYMLLVKGFRSIVHASPQ